MTEQFKVPRFVSVWLSLLVLGCGRFGYEPRAPANRPPVDGELPDSLGDGGPWPGTAPWVSDGGSPVPPVGAGLDGGGVELDDGGVDAAVQNDCLREHPGALVCSGFEGELETYWRLNLSNGVATVSSEYVRSGVAALNVGTTAPGGLAFATRPFEPVDAELWVRMHLFVPSGAYIYDINVLGVDHEGSAVAGLDFSLIEDGELEIYSPELGSLRGPPTVRMARDRWACAQLHIVVSDTAGAVELFVDGNRYIDVQGVDTRPGGAYDRLNVGLDWTHPTQAPMELFVDDVVVATSEVPCL